MNLKINYYDFSEGARGSFDDCVSEAIGETDDLEAVFDNLPLDLKLLAVRWGLSDTPFRDEVFALLRKERGTPFKA